MNVNRDEYYMGLALREARRGVGRTSPNPCVGAVIVREDKVVAKGFHKKAGTPHAEINALQMAGEMSAGAEMYVTLEPCNHFGRTAPCSHAVASSGIKRVIVGMRDPNPLVDGTGIDYLLEKGVEVVWGVLEEECRQLNRAFIKYITTNRPWVVMKAGISLDGRLSYRLGSGGSITGPESFRKVHRLRDRLDAILVGSGTVISDDPRLTTRLPQGAGCNPVRIILDTNLSVSSSARIFDVKDDAPTWVFCSDAVSAARIDSLRQRGVKVFPVAVDEKAQLDLDSVLQISAANEITSILVEGGGRVHSSFIYRRLYDYAYLFYAPVFAGSGGAPLISGLRVEGGKESSVRLRQVTTRRYGEDMLVKGEFLYPT